MTTATLRPADLAARPPVVPLALAAALALGVLAAGHPMMAVAAALAATLLALAFLAPVTHLVLLVAATAIVPYGILNRFSFGGGVDSPGLLVTDVLLAGGLLRAALVLPDVPLRRRARALAALVLALLGLFVVQFLHGLAAGHDRAVSGSELRILLGFGVALVALPVLADPRSRDRLFRGLVPVGLALGLWGVAQWTLDIPFDATGDAGVRAGVSLTTAGKGQIQGGLYAFPVAIILAFAALIASDGRRPARRGVLLAVLALNAVSLMLSYERTFWIATLAGCTYVVLKAGPPQRARALVLGPVVLGLLLAALAIVAPAELSTAGQRLGSVGDYGSDNSLRYRLEESRHVVAEVRAHPLAGSGLGAGIIWGRPWEQVKPGFETFAHNGYLWLAWKLGVPLAVLVVLLVAAAALWRGPPGGRTTPDALRAGAQGAFLALLVVSVTFPAFATLGITAVMGLLLPLAAAPWQPRRRRAPGAPVTRVAGPRATGAAAAPR